jgi:hypothetical protein
VGYCILALWLHIWETVEKGGILYSDPVAAYQGDSCEEWDTVFWPCGCISGRQLRRVGYCILALWLHIRETVEKSGIQYSDPVAAYLGVI